MSREEITKNIGALVEINGSGDLGIKRDLRKYIDDTIGQYCLRIERLTKGGMVVVRCGSEMIIVPPKNVDLYGTKV